MSNKTETILFETGNVMLKVVTTYDLRVKAPQVMEIDIAGETRRLEQPHHDTEPVPHDVVHTLRLSNVNRAETVEVQLTSDELEDLNRSIEKAMTKKKSRF